MRHCVSCFRASSPEVGCAGTCNHPCPRMFIVCPPMWKAASSSRELLSAELCGASKNTCFHTFCVYVSQTCRSFLGDVRALVGALVGALHRSGHFPFVELILSFLEKEKPRYLCILQTLLQALLQVIQCSYRCAHKCRNSNY